MTEYDMTTKNFNFDWRRIPARGFNNPSFYVMRITVDVLIRRNNELYLVPYVKEYETKSLGTNVLDFITTSLNEMQQIYEKWIVNDQEIEDTDGRVKLVQKPIKEYEL